MELIEFKNIYSELIDKGIKYGLTIDDYKKVKKIICNIDQVMVATDSQWYDMYIKFKNIYEKFYYDGIIHSFSDNNCNYIIYSSLLLPLVLANSKEKSIKMYSDNSYMFSCQFHNERTPSLGVTDWNNLGFCFGCGTSFNVVSYLKLYENLNYKKAIELLAYIYLFDIKKQPNSDFMRQLVIKYQDSILSQDYLDLLLMGQERLKKRNKYNHDFYQQRFDTIERIRKNEYDPNFLYEETPKKLYLDKNNYFIN